jgi:hypothetical protein
VFWILYLCLTTILISLYMRNLFLISFCLLLKTVFAQPPGTLDPSFGNNGIVLSPIGVSATEAKTILLQPDGKANLQILLLQGTMRMVHPTPLLALMG